MRRADRMPAVETECEPAVRRRLQLENRQPFALERVEHREIPRQRVRAQLPARRDDRVEEFTERLRKAVVRAFGHEAQPAVDVPADAYFRAVRRAIAEARHSI